MKNVVQIISEQYNTKKKKKFLLSLLLCEFVSDGVFDGGTGTLVDDWIPERNMQEEWYHQHQVCRVTQSHRNTPIILCCSGKEKKKLNMLENLFK